jgi:hypothetical protein
MQMMRGPAEPDRNKARAFFQAALNIQAESWSVRQANQFSDV